MHKRACSPIAGFVVMLILGAIDPPPAATQTRRPDSKLVSVRLAGLIEPRIRYAGYLIAIQKDYYSQAGLAVSTVRQSERDSIDAVVSGTADFGIASAAKLLKAHGDGQPVVLLAAIQQHSPQALMVSQTVAASPAKLVDAKIIAQRTVDRIGFDAVLRNQGLDPSRANWVFQDGALDAFVSDDGAMLAGDLTTLPLLLRRRGHPVQVMRPGNYTLSIYGDCLFTSRDFVHRNQRTVAAFVAGTRRGWRRTFTHPAETIAYLAQLQGDGKSDAALLRFELERSSPLILPNVVDIGHVNPSRMHRILSNFKSRGYLHDDVNLNGFLYERESGSPLAGWAIPIAVVAAAASGVTSLVLAWNATLRRQVANRTAALENEAAIRQQAEQSLRDVNQTLETRVAERTAKLAETNVELETLAQSVAHDLRAPLRAMEGFAAALVEDYSGQIGEEGREYLGRIVDSAKRMDLLVNDLLSYSRLSRMELQFCEIDLNSVVGDALRELSSEIEACDAKVEVAEQLPIVLGHRTALEQVVTNLVSNGLKFVPPGVRPELHIWWQANDDDTIRLCLEDNGIGIEADYQERIFHVFERVHSLETYPGTGIGLAIVARACKRLGGRCGVDSRPGQGSRFWIEIPSSEANS